MKAIGIDLGTTSICGVLIDAQSGKMLHSITKTNTATMQNSRPFERIQSPRVVTATALEIIEQLRGMEREIAVIGITGQMHGILYVDQKGEAVSPLYTWQDESGAQNSSTGVSYAEELSARTGYAVHSGYGCVTCYSHFMREEVPHTARGVCTIGDYLGMLLTNTPNPVIHSSNAASLGCYRICDDAFDLAALAKAGVDTSFFPQVEGGYRLVGETPQGIKVACALGDNQASFLGAVKDMRHSILVNVGTGSQISLMAAEDIRHAGEKIDLRPCVGNKRLLVGASLCGGRAYHLLERFFQSVFEFSGEITEDALYDKMEKAGSSALQRGNRLTVSTKFCGTRQNPAERGSILNIGLSNFEAGPMVIGFLEGIAGELLELYQDTKGKTFSQPAVLVGSGNGIRKNKLLQQICENLFELPIKIPRYQEEAAYGAALYSLVCAGEFQTIEQAQTGIAYL